MSIQVFKASAQLKEGVQVELSARNHKILMDEPESLGGTDLGMNPVEGLLASLGACKCIVARMFAQHHNIDLQDIHIELEGDLDTDGFSGKNPEAKIGFIEIRSKVTIKSTSSKEAIEAFVNFIDRTCPVADTIVNPAILVTELTIE